MLRFGAVAAGLNCGQVGCHPPVRADVNAVLAA
jgi:fructokinase